VESEDNPEIRQNVLIARQQTTPQRPNVLTTPRMPSKNDPVFEHLARVDRFDQRLYWVGHTSYTPPGQATPIDIRLTAKTLISAAIRSLEEGPERKTLLAEAYLLAAQFDAVLTLQSDEMSPSLTQAVGWALTMQGNSLADCE